MNFKCGQRVAWMIIQGVGMTLAATVCHLSGQPPRTHSSPDGTTMVLVPAGPFLMGSLDGDPDEAPSRTVTLPAYYIDRFEVTHAQYAKFVQATGHKPPIDWPGGKPYRAKGQKRAQKNIDMTNEQSRVSAHEACRKLRTTQRTQPMQTP